MWLCQALGLVYGWLCSFLLTFFHPHPPTPPLILATSCLAAPPGPLIQFFSSVLNSLSKTSRSGGRCPGASGTKRAALSVLTICGASSPVL